MIDGVKKPVVDSDVESEVKPKSVKKNAKKQLYSDSSS